MCQFAGNINNMDLVYLFQNSDSFCKAFPTHSTEQRQLLHFPNVASNGCGSVEDIATSDATHIAYRARKPLGLFHCILCESVEGCVQEKGCPYVFPDIMNQILP